LNCFYIYAPLQVLGSVSPVTTRDLRPGADIWKTVRFFYGHRVWRLVNISYSGSLIKSHHVLTQSVALLSTRWWRDWNFRFANFSTLWGGGSLGCRLWDIFTS